MQPLVTRQTLPQLNGRLLPSYPHDEAAPESDPQLLAVPTREAIGENAAVPPALPLVGGVEAEPKADREGLEGGEVLAEEDGIAHEGTVADVCVVETRVYGQGYTVTKKKMSIWAQHYYCTRYPN